MAISSPSIFYTGLVLSLFAPALSRGAAPLRLEEPFRAGYEYHVSARVELSGSLTLPPSKEQPAPKPIKITGNSAIEYDERVLALKAGSEVQKTARIYRRIEFHRTVGSRPQDSTIRSEVRRLVVLRHRQVEVPFSPDGPLTVGEIDLVRTDVFTPALAGLFPGKEVQIGDRWTAAPAAIQELTDMERIDDGGVGCRLEEVFTQDGRRHARVAFKGTVRGLNEDGPNRQQIDGYYYFDLDARHLSYLYLNGVSALLDKGGKELGRVEGRFVLTRQLGRSRDLADEALKGVGLEPNDDNTLLLYDNADLGVRFLYPRRWHLAAGQGRQVALDDNAGNGLLLTLEPAARVPTGAQFLKESREFLERQARVRVRRIDAPRQVQGAPRALEHFAMEVEADGKGAVMDYYVVRQATGGATLAARRLPADTRVGRGTPRAVDLAAVQKDVERIARSVTVTRTLTAEGKP
jgi:hypothetical protein